MSTSPAIHSLIVIVVKKKNFCALIQNRFFITGGEAAGRYITVGMLKITRKQLIKHYWKYDKQQRISAAANTKTLKEPEGFIRASFKQNLKCLKNVTTLI